LRQIANQAIDVAEVVVNLFVIGQLAFFRFGQGAGPLFFEQPGNARLHRGGRPKNDDALFKLEVNRAVAQQGFRQTI